MPPVIPPRSIVAQQAMPAGPSPIIRHSALPPLSHPGVSTAKAISVDKKSLVTIEQSGPPIAPTFKVRSARGTLLYADKQRSRADAWIE